MSKCKENVAAAMGYLIVGLAKAPVPHVKLMKLLYLSEKAWLMKTSATMAGDQFCALPEGPVLSGTYNLMKKNAGTNAWNTILTSIDGNPIDIKDKEFIPRTCLTPYQMATIVEVWEEHGAKSEAELVSLTHEFEEWIRSRPDEDSKSKTIPYKNIFAAEKVPEKDVKNRLYIALTVNNISSGRII